MLLQGCVAFLPFARVSLKSLIVKPYDFVPISVGDHIRKRRLELGLLQKEAALQIGVNPWTVLNWEKSHTEPPVSAMRAILQFLGYDPCPEPRTLPERLLAKRREMGQRRILDGGDDPELAAAVRAGFDVNGEYPPKALHPTHGAGGVRRK